MGDKIKYTKYKGGERLEDNHGNVAANGGLFCAETKEIIPSNQITKEEKYLVGVPVSMAVQPGGQEPVEKEIALGDLPSPLRAVCEQRAQNRTRE